MINERKTCGCAKKPSEFSVTDITDMTDEAIDAEIDKGYQDYLKDNMIDGEFVFEKYRLLYAKTSGYTIK